jgi:uncharacterized protein DUF3617
LFCLLQALTISASAETLGIEPGQWKVTSNTRMNGQTMPPGERMRCLTPEQATDVAQTFGPASNTINSTCAPTETETTGTKLKWRLQCRGQLDVDVSGDFNFDSPTHYTATVISKGSMAGALVSDVKTELTGEHVGACPQ